MEGRLRSKIHYRLKKNHYRDKYLQRKYGITIEQYDSMLASQNNKCALCNEQFVKPPHVDHCHKTLRVRGLLCNYCNRWVLPQVEKVGPEKFSRYLNIE